jgi:hypothetical protein
MRMRIFIIIMINHAEGGRSRKEEEEEEQEEEEEEELKGPHFILFQHSEGSTFYFISTLCSLISTCFINICCKCFRSVTAYVLINRKFVTVEISPHLKA